MLKLTMQCSRCGEVVEREVKDAAATVSNLMGEHGFKYIFIGETNRLVCRNCRHEFVAFQEELEEEVAKLYCNFFKKERNDELK